MTRKSILSTQTYSSTAIEQPKARKNAEYTLQVACINYMKAQFPNVLFLSDTVANVKLTSMQAARNKAIQKPGFATPDIVIFQPTDQFHGLFIELKAENPYTKQGELKKMFKLNAKNPALSYDHLERQHNSMVKLANNGYKCYFCWSTLGFIEILSNYIHGGNKNNHKDTYREVGKQR